MLTMGKNIFTHVPGGRLSFFPPKEESPTKRPLKRQPVGAWQESHSLGSQALSQVTTIYIKGVSLRLTNYSSS